MCVASTPETDVTTAALLVGADLARNNGLTYQPIGRAVDGGHAADSMIGTYWDGTMVAWKPPKAPAVGTVKFSDGAGNKIDAKGHAGFEIVAGATDSG